MKTTNVYEFAKFVNHEFRNYNNVNALVDFGFISALNEDFECLLLIPCKNGHTVLFDMNTPAYIEGMLDNLYDNSAPLMIIQYDPINGVWNGDNTTKTYAIDFYNGKI